MTNAGRINANGTVALVAPNVSNSGVVNAKIGSVSLGGTNKFTVDFNGDGLVSFAAGDASKASVSNTGRLTGANVSMTARTAEGLATGVVSTGGILTATGANGIGGNITIDAGDGGKINVTNAKLVATGRNGGGNVSIGGWNHGSVTVDKKSNIDASASLRGDGGHVSIIAGDTIVKGSISTKGGKHSGNGGMIETSGHTLDFDGSKINADAKHGESGSWLLDPTDLIITTGSAATISSTLATTNVTLATTSTTTSDTTSSATAVSGSGDIIVEGAISWSSNKKLELDAYHSVDIYAPITVLGAGQLALKTNNASGSGGILQINSPVTFSTPASASLTINSLSYIIEPTFAALDSAANATPGGRYALATDLNVGSTTYLGSPISTTFTGKLEGLGHTISNLTITDSSSNNTGLFTAIGIGGTVENLHLNSVSVTHTANAPYTGGLVGYFTGDSILNVTVSGSVTSAGGNVGGLVGLVNSSSATISGSWSSATVTGAGVGASVGGLIGSLFFGGTVVNSYATGSVSSSGSGTVDILGGLVGYASHATIRNSYATGSVSGSANEVGGLVGYNSSSAGASTITMSYATGSVHNFANSYTGGLVGANDPGSSITLSYASGQVTEAISSFAGGLVGSNSGTLQNSVWDLLTTVQPFATGSGTPSTNVNVNGSSHYTASSYTPFTFNTTVGSTSSWVLVDANGSLNNASAAAGATRPMLNSEYSISITNAHQLQLMAESLSATYLIDNNINAVATAGTADIWSSAGFVPVGGNAGTNFTGSLLGLNAQISDLTINSNQTNVGLFGISNTISNVMLVNPSVTGGTSSQFVGTLAGKSGGNITAAGSVGGTVTSNGSSAVDIGGLVGSQTTGTTTQSYASTTVHAATASSFAGGLVGFISKGTISQSFAEGSVTADGASSAAGGLIGSVGGGTVTTSFAFGNASAPGSSSSSGGLFGSMTGGAVSNLYSTGMASGTTANGAIGTKSAGTLTNVYWDTQTSGLSSDGGGATGETTHDLQHALLTGLDAGSFLIVADVTFPYLSWMTSGTPQVVSGKLYSDRGTTPLAAASYGIAIGGSTPSPLAAFGTTGADGYYYQLLPAATISGGGSNVAAYATGVQHALSYMVATGSVTSLDLYGGWTRMIGSAATYTAMLSGLSNAIGALSIAPAPNLEIDALGSSFDFNANPGYPGNKLMVSTNGTVTQSAALTVSKLMLTGTGTITLDNAANHIGDVSGSASGLTLKTADALTVDALTAGNSVALTSSGAITVGGLVTGNAVGLMAGGTLKSKGAGAVDAGIFYGSSAGGVSLAGANRIDDIEGFTNTGAGSFTLNDTVDLEIGGAIDAGDAKLLLSTTGDLSVSANVGALNNVTLHADGALTSTSGISSSKTLALTAGSIDTSDGTLAAKVLAGSTNGSADMSGANSVAQLGAFTTAGGAFTFFDTDALLVTGGVNSDSAGGNGALTIDANGNLTIKGSLTGGTVSLTSDTGAILEKPGYIVADLLNVSAATGYNLSGPNDITALGTIQTTKGQKKLVQHGSS